MVALPSITEDGVMYFAKNSDRDPNEAQHIIYSPSKDHSSNSMVKCTYIEVPQVKHTYANLLSKPFWMWGGEMGVNEHGVAIGNEAVFTKAPYGKEPGLIGMDFLRLALQRSSTAYQALQSITELLEKYGQSGNCSYEHQLFYHNSYIISDREEAWVLKMVEKQWAAIKVKEFYSISNALTISNQWNLASKDIIHYAMDKGWCKTKSEFDFARCYSDIIFTTFSQGKKRRLFSEEFLRNNRGKINPSRMMELLRGHSKEQAQWHPDRSLKDWTICMHKGFGPIRASQTVSSMVSRLSRERDTHWFTASAAPCTSIFMPIWMDADLPDFGEEPTNVFNNKSYWWRHELLYREVMRDYSSRITAYEDERNLLEKEFVNQEKLERLEDNKKRSQYTKNVFQTITKAKKRWYELVKSTPQKRNNSFYFEMEWKNINKKAQLYL